MGGFAGPDAEDISASAGSLRNGKSSPGPAYNFVNGWPASGSFQLAEVEVYCNANVKKYKSSGGGWFR